MEKEPLLLELETRHQELQEFLNLKVELTMKTGAVIHDREIKLEKLEKVKN